MDLVISITNVFHKHLGELSPEYKRELVNSISRYMKSYNDEALEEMSFKTIEKVARLQSKVFTESD
jgi:hypothetical protein